MLLQTSIDPGKWLVGLPSGLPRMSSPIILKRDLTTFTYLANKRNLRSLSLHMIQKMKTTPTILRPTRDHLKAHYWLECRRLPIRPIHPGPQNQAGQCTMPPLPSTRLRPTLDMRMPMPCPALKELRDTLIQETIPAHLRQILTHTEKHQEHLLPQLNDLCRALRTGLINNPHRELL